MLVLEDRSRPNPSWSFVMPVPVGDPNRAKVCSPIGS